MRTHPEQREDETYLGNTKASGFPPARLAPLKTLRLGDAAYDIDGKKLPLSWGLRPLFVRQSEAGAYDSIMMAELRAIQAGRT